MRSACSSSTGKAASGPTWRRNLAPAFRYYAGGELRHGLSAARCRRSPCHAPVSIQLARANSSACKGAPESIACTGPAAALRRSCSRASNSAASCPAAFAALATRMISTSRSRSSPSCVPTALSSARNTGAASSSISSAEQAARRAKPPDRHTALVDRVRIAAGDDQPVVAEEVAKAVPGDRLESRGGAAALCETDGARVDRLFLRAECQREGPRGLARRATNRDLVPRAAAMASARTSERLPSTSSSSSSQIASLLPRPRSCQCRKRPRSPTCQTGYGASSARCCEEATCSSAAPICRAHASGPARSPGTATGRAISPAAARSTRPDGLSNVQQPRPSRSARTLWHSA